MSQISVSLSCRGPSLHRVNVIQQTAAQPGRSPAAGEVTDRYPLFAVEPASVNHLASIRCRRDGASSFETVLFAKTRHLLSNPARAMHPNRLSHAFPRSATAQPAGPIRRAGTCHRPTTQMPDICDLVTTPDQDPDVRRTICKLMRVALRA